MLSHTYYLLSQAHGISSNVISYEWPNYPYAINMLLSFHMNDLIRHLYDITTVCLCHTEELVSRPYEITNVSRYTVTKPYGWLSKSSELDDNNVNNGELPHWNIRIAQLHCTHSHPDDFATIYLFHCSDVTWASSLLKSKCFHAMMLFRWVDESSVCDGSCVWAKCW